MCGIVGVMANPLLMLDKARFESLFAIAQVRGQDGCGLFTVPKKAYGSTAAISPNEVFLAKSLHTSGQFAASEQFGKMLNKDITIAVGHARAATKGALVRENLHPHVHKHICLVHNGTMYDVMGKSIKDTQSDSKMLAEALASNDLQKVVDDSWGAMCLIWIDFKTQTLNFFRNDQRPMWFATQGHTETYTDALYWASEAGMLHFVLNRHSSTLVKKTKIFALPEYEHHVYPLAPAYNIQPTEKITIKKKVWGSSQTHTGHTWSSTALGTGTASTNTNDYGFKYIPPSERGIDVKTPATTVADLFLAHRLKAVENKVKKERAVVVPSGGTGVKPFLLGPASTSADAFLVTEKHEIQKFVHGACCAWCSDTPAFNVDKPPKIYSLQSKTGMRDYYCDDCVTSIPEVHNIFGLAKVG